MDIEQEKSRIKKWIAGYLALGFVFLIIGLAVPLFLILTAVFLFIAFLMFKDIKELDEEEPIKTKVQEVVIDNLEEKQINTEVNKMQVNMNREEIAQVMAALGSAENTQLFLKVTDGQMNYAIMEKLKAELEAKPQKKQETASPKKPEKQEEPDSEEDEEMIVED